VRLLQALQRRRAALVSVAGHAVLIAVLALVGTRTGIPSRESPLIVAELVTALEPSPSAAIEVAPDSPEAAPAEESAPAPQPPVAELDPAAPAPAPPAQPETLPEPTTEPPTEAPPIERLAEREESATEPGIEPPAQASPSEAAEPPTAAETVADDTPRRAFASREEESVRRKLASWTGRFETDKGEPTLTWRDDGQQYTAVLKRSAAADSTGMERLVVELTTERDGQRLATELRMTRLAFSNFGQFVNRWDPEVGLNDDVIDGRFHSNTGVTINRTGRATPVFGGKVTIAGGEVVTMAEGFLSSHPARLNKRKLFPAGLETHARRIELPERATALEAISSPDNSQRFARDTALTFHDDGSVSWREGGAAEARRALGGEPFYLLADDDVELEVSGTVNGKVLVYTPDRIVVTGDLRYATDPSAPQADDYLGLVAERTVEIAEPEITGPGDLEIFASIYARQRFVVRDYTSRRSGTLIVHGSLTAGTLSASEPRFATRVEFDDRLTTMRAPGFPLSDRYELDSASGEWRVVDTP
jgi:outer membrane biosynthesis protein TonB